MFHFRFPQLFLIFFIPPTMIFAVQLTEPDIIKLGFTGDTMQSYELEPYLQAYGDKYPFTMLFKKLQSYDILAGNLECPISTTGTAIKNKRFYFKARPSSAVALKWAGFKIMSLANNHIMDFGDNAFFETMAILDENEIKYVGAGRNISEANNIKIIRIRNRKVGFLSFNDIPPDYYAATAETPGTAKASRENIISTIRANREKVDILVVMFHWGIEYQYTPEPQQRDLGHLAIDVGADIVIGTHPHVVQPFEYYKGKVIAYSLGNFAFGSYGDPPAHTADYGMILEAEVKDRDNIKIRIIPINVFNYDVKFMPRLPIASKNEAFLNIMNKMCLPYGASIDLNGVIRQVPAKK